MKKLTLISIALLWAIYSTSVLSQELSTLPVEILGMKLSDVSKMNIGNIHDAYTGQTDTKHWLLKDSTGRTLHLDVRVEDDVIVKITNTDGRYKTKEGLSVGLSFTKVIEIYNSLYVVPNNAGLSTSVIALGVGNTNLMFTLKAMPANDKSLTQYTVKSIQVQDLTKFNKSTIINDER